MTTIPIADPGCRYLDVIHLSARLGSFLSLSVKFSDLLFDFQFGAYEFWPFFGALSYHFLCFLSHGCHDFKLILDFREHHVEQLVSLALLYSCVVACNVRDA
jgi:hypothetical protein